MALELRMFREADYRALVDLLNAMRPERPISVRELREDDRAVPAHLVLERWLAEDGGRLVGSGAFGHSEDSYHPRRFWLRVGVHPAHLGRGVGTELYHRLAARLAPHEPVFLATKAREDESCKTRFFEQRGFVEAMREFESRLDVAACDLNPYEAGEDKLGAQGISLRSLAQLKHDADYRRKLYDLHTTLDADVPAIDPYTPPSYRTFALHHFESPRLIEESFFVAVQDGHYLGMSELWRADAGPYLRTGLTGVLPAWRRRGVALALKVAGIRFAKAHGYPEIRTENAAHNRAMLSINERLGYRKQPATILYRKVFAAG